MRKKYNCTLYFIYVIKCYKTSCLLIRMSFRMCYILGGLFFSSNARDVSKSTCSTSLTIIPFRNYTNRIIKVSAIEGFTRMIENVKSFFMKVVTGTVNNREKNDVKHKDLMQWSSTGKIS
jgi:hypothetical protein